MISRKQLEEIAATVEGVPIFGCLPRSTADSAGVRYGDIVLSVNGVRTKSIEQYMAGRARRADGMELRILRAGQELSLFVAFGPPEDDLEAFAGKIAEGRYLGKSEIPEANSKGPPS
jgi:S1-C subfamily serine protease